MEVARISDLAAFTLPVNALRVLMKACNLSLKSSIRKYCKDSRKGGYKTTSGPDGSGQLLMVYDRGGGK